VNRLAIRLALAMMAVAVIAMLAISLSQVLIVNREYRNLPPEVRDRIERLREARGPFRPQRPRDGGGQPAEGQLPPVDFVVVPLPEDDLVRGFNDVRSALDRAMVMGLAVAGLVSIALAALLARTIARPIASVSRAAERVAGGDLGARVETRTGGSETAQLMHNFNRMAGSLERYEVERRAMIADIAHELRTPLAAMQLRLEALLDGLTPFGDDEAERLHRQTELLTRLVEDLRTLSLAEGGRLQLDRRSVDLGELAAAAVDAFRSRADAEGVELHLDAGATPVGAWADPDRIVQALTNLIDNAVRATPEGGRVVVAVVAGDDDARIAVRDDGPGIADEDLPRLFERFTQGSDTRGKSGLGLAIVRTLVELHGGSVSVRNRDRGAEFVIALPRGGADG
jgi:signal transduction histidine kinase